MKINKITFKEIDYKFNEPFAFDLIEYQIATGEQQETLIKLQEESSKFIGKDDTEKTDAELLEVNKLVSKINLEVARRDKANYEFAIKHLVDVKTDLFSLEDAKAFKLPMDLLKDIVEAFSKPLTVEEEQGKKQAP